MAKIKAEGKELTEGLEGLKQGGVPVRFPEGGKGGADYPEGKLWCDGEGGSGRGQELPAV